MRHWANEQCVKDREILKVAQNHGKVAIIWPPIHVTDLKKKSTKPWCNQVNALQYGKWQNTY